MGDLIRVLIAEYDPMGRKLLTDWLQRADRVEVVGTAATTDEAMGEAARARPDVVLMDMDLALGREQVERSKFEIVERFDRPTVLPVRSHEPLKVFLATKELGICCPRLVQRPAAQPMHGLVKRHHGLWQRRFAGSADGCILSAQKFLGLGRPGY